MCKKLPKMPMFNPIALIMTYAVTAKEGQGFGAFIVETFGDPENPWPEMSELTCPVKAMKLLESCFSEETENA